MSPPVVPTVSHLNAVHNLKYLSTSLFKLSPQELNLGITGATSPSLHTSLCLELGLYLYFSVISSWIQPKSMGRIAQSI